MVRTTHRAEDPTENTCGKPRAPIVTTQVASLPWDLWKRPPAPLLPGETNGLQIRIDGRFPRRHKLHQAMAVAWQGVVELKCGTATGRGVAADRTLNRGRATEP